MSEILIDTFSRYFCTALADTEELRRKAFNIRYEVYCREFGFEREEDCPGNMESDDYDIHAVHCLLLHKLSGSAVGCGRLILPQADDPQASLPFERYCRHALDPEVLTLLDQERAKIGEFSRLAVMPSFRRRLEDERKPLSFPDSARAMAHGREPFPLISLSLILAGCAMFMHSSLDYCIAMMEPRLARMLRLYGLYFERIGQVVDYHGQRGPFMIVRDQVLANFKPDISQLMTAIDGQLYPIPPFRRDDSRAVPGSGRDDAGSERWGNGSSLRDSFRPIQ